MAITQPNRFNTQTPSARGFCICWFSLMLRMIYVGLPIRKHLIFTVVHAPIPQLSTWAMIWAWSTIGHVNGDCPSIQTLPSKQVWWPFTERDVQWIIHEHSLIKSQQRTSRNKNTMELYLTPNCPLLVKSKLLFPNPGKELECRDFSPNIYQDTPSSEMYKLYVRPHLDYGNVLYHIPHSFWEFSQSAILTK